MYYNSERRLGDKLKKKSMYRFAGPEIFPRFEADLDFQKSSCRLKDRVYRGRL